MVQSRLNRIHDAIDDVFDWAVGAVYDKETLDKMIDGRERLHTLVDNLRKSSEIEEIEERVTPLDFHTMYDEDGTD